MALLSLAASLARDAEQRPRTRHLLEDGTPEYTNRLILEPSPYLQQHAHNPVNWYPWGDEAFDAARRLGRPVLLSVGYSTCHWCHVMEEESFEDEEIARYLNENYVAIKVDREERPDIDAIYMSAVQALTGGGGWPMTVWLRPDRTPFYGATYLPARDGDRGAARGFLTILRMMREAYDTQPEQVASVATRLVQRIRDDLGHGGGSSQAPDGACLDRAASIYRNRFDATWGGLNQAPKFPSSLPVRFLLRRGDPAEREMALLTLDRMAQGGMHDQIGGGFHRYSTDRQWLVPHFEKMLYDNALLTIDFLEAYQLSGRDEFAVVARGILDEIRREFASPEGGFYSATDADSAAPDGKREEGRFFTWTPAELAAAVGDERAALLGRYYGVTDGGNLGGRSILHVARPAADVAESAGMSETAFRAMLDAANATLLATRARRPAPLRDEKVVTSWNGLAISAFARASFVLDDPALAQVAERAAAFLLARQRKDGRLLRRSVDGTAQGDAFLDDYAFLIAGLLDLYESTSDPSWLTQAMALQATLDAHFADDEHGGYFATSDDHEALLAREKPAYDGAEPSGNSVEALNLLRFHALTSDDRFRKRADRLLAAFGSTLASSPTSLSEMLLAVEFRLAAPREIVIVAPTRREEAEPFLQRLRRTFLPDRVLVVAVEGADLEAQARVVPILRGKLAAEGRATAYVCRGGVCRLPTSDPEAFAAQLVPVSGAAETTELGRSRGP